MNSEEFYKKSIAEFKKKLLEYDFKSSAKGYNYGFNPTKRESLDERLKEVRLEAKKTENDNTKQDMALKKGTLIALFIFLALETALVFYFTYLQGKECDGFHLEEWSFKLLLGATIFQISYMLKIAVQHLFPNKNNLKK